MTNPGLPGMGLSNLVPPRTRLWEPHLDLGQSAANRELGPAALVCLVTRRRGVTRYA